MSLPRTEFPPHPDPRTPRHDPLPDPDSVSPAVAALDRADLNCAVPDAAVPDNTVPDSTAPQNTAPVVTDPDPGAPARRPVRAVSAALRARYADPARAQAVPAGPLFDVVSVGMDVGLETLDLMLRSGVPLGPVAADARAQVRRVGFLLPPGSLARLAGFAWWCRSHGLRTATHGDVVALPPLIADAQARLQWLVPPDAVPGTDPALLLSCLRRALGRRRPHAHCQVSAG